MIICKGTARKARRIIANDVLLKAMKRSMKKAAFYRKVKFVSKIKYRQIVQCKCGYGVSGLVSRPCVRGASYEYSLLGST
jgi:hypothetical protein